MSPEKRRRITGPFKIDVTQEEILEDLLWPERPPGQWRVARPTVAEAAAKPSLSARTRIG